MWAQPLAVIGYLQQSLPSQQAGLSQQVKTVAACAGKESKTNAATANASTLNFITILLLNRLLSGVARQIFAALFPGERR
jgi:hypothetical protein